MKEFFDSDKHIIAFVLLIFLIVWVVTRDDVITRMMDKGICKFEEITAPTYRGLQKKTSRARKR